jgi:dihydroorotate dehydrogenase electron transfer subunit
MTVLKVLEVRPESADAVTLTFTWHADAIPGQFTMVWLPGVDEVPMSLSVVEPGVKGITVVKVGEATGALHALKPGDRLGVRGPYGNGYALPMKKRVLAVAGGSGVASIASAVEAALARGSGVTVVLGARSASRLLLEERLRKTGVEVRVATDDGSKGFRGFATALASNALADGKYDLVLTCGPEAMMVQVVDAAAKSGVEVQASLERYMKCGLGLCGSCGLGPYRVCADGPVFTGRQLASVTDFGKSKLTPDGRRAQL